MLPGNFSLKGRSQGKSLLKLVKNKNSIFIINLKINYKLRIDNNNDE